MASLFSKIMSGEIPGRFVWQDDECMAFLTIEPLAMGHTLVVPRQEIDQWIDLPASLRSHLFNVAAVIGRAQRVAFECRRIGLLIQGYEIPHAHLHVWPSMSAGDFDLAKAATNVPASDMDAAAEALRAQLRRENPPERVPAS